MKTNTESGSLPVRRFLTKDEFIKYINEKYGPKYSEKILTTIDYNDGVPTKRYYIENKDGEIVFSEKLADIGFTIKDKHPNLF